MVYVRHMVRTQIYLPKKLYLRVQLRAAQEKVPAAAVVRSLLEDGLDRAAQGTAGEALLRLASIGAKGPKDLSQRIDDYLYGEAE